MLPEAVTNVSSPVNDELPRSRFPGTATPYTSAVSAGDLARVGPAEAGLANGRDRRIGIVFRRVDAAEDDVVARLEARVAARVEDPDLAEAGLRGPGGGAEGARAAVRLRIGDEHDR